MTKLTLSVQVQLRETCLMSLQQSREEVLRRAREAKQQGRNTDSLQNDLLGIIQSAQQAMVDNVHSAPNDQGAGNGPTAMNETRALSTEDYAELVHSLEEELYRESVAHEMDYLDALEARAMDDMFETHFGLASGAGEEFGQDITKVMCPLCKVNWLYEAHGVICCPRDHLRLDRSYEGIRLDSLSQRLHALHQVHGACAEGPVFSQRSNEGTNYLVMECKSCSAMEIVL